MQRPLAPSLSSFVQSFACVSGLTSRVLTDLLPGCIEEECPFNRGLFGHDFLQLTSCALALDTAQ